ncbi:hypothetical protein Lesp02_44230 [Lentzea sp. NBRC 105346]|uniref:hypothetical protein n=1 Tax=Lentzea sp. NBRC 105346 TaxID=3032205 RepID=UPI0024A0307D|nr:hypothetical protein [Lentzea sp. NBRC 105346]GLZ32235.1 hypothetical protein Lesp02_44230 [Lentzea sp. NBRC 105346]
MRRRVVVIVAAAIVVGGVGGTAVAMAASDAEPTNKIVTMKGGGQGADSGRVTAKCPKGFQVTGGGFKNKVSLQYFLASYPESDLSGWTVEERPFEVTDPHQERWGEFEAYAVCAPVAG